MAEILDHPPQVNAASNILTSGQMSPPLASALRAERMIVAQPTITSHHNHGAQAHVTVVINPPVTGAPSSPRPTSGCLNRRRRNSGGSGSTAGGRTPSLTHASDTTCEIEAPAAALIEHPSTTYERNLMTKGLGFPMWTPQPNMLLPKEYRRKGVMIGDVGFITEHGAFEFLFNICLSPSDPINPPDLPEGFTQLCLCPGDTRGFRELTAGSSLTSSTVKSENHVKNSQHHSGGGTTFQSSAAEGAILSIPNGAYHEELNNIAGFREYMATHVEGWYKWAKRRGREVQNGDIRLVVGYDKATSWGMACFRNTSKHQRFSLTFSQNEANERETGCPYLWEHTGTSVDVKTGPDHWDTEDLRQNDEPPLQNQCLFLKTLNALLADDVWASMQMPCASNLDVDNLANVPNCPSESQGQTPPAGDRSLSIATFSQEGTPSHPQDNLRYSHPSYAINSWLLKQVEHAEHPRPRLVITDDSVWSGALADRVNVLLDPRKRSSLVDDYFQQIRSRNDIFWSDRNVALYLCPKDSPASRKSEEIMDSDPIDDVQHIPRLGSTDLCDKDSMDDVCDFQVQDQPIIHREDSSFTLGPSKPFHWGHQHFHHSKQDTRNQIYSPPSPPLLYQPNHVQQQHAVYDPPEETPAQCETTNEGRNTIRRQKKLPVRLAQLKNAQEYFAVNGERWVLRTPTADNAKSVKEGDAPRQAPITDIDRDQLELHTSVKCRL